MLDNIRSNTKINQHSIHDSKENTDNPSDHALNVAHLDWLAVLDDFEMVKKVLSCNNDAKYDIALLADCIYTDDMTVPLANAIEALITDHGVVYSVFPGRRSGVDKFIETMESKGWIVTTLPVSKQLRRPQFGIRWTLYPEEARMVTFRRATSSRKSTFLDCGASIGRVPPQPRDEDATLPIA